MPSTAVKYKYISLAVLVVQTTTLVLILRYSRTAAVDGPRYLSSTAIVASETLKILICLVLLFREQGKKLTCCLMSVVLVARPIFPKQ